MLLDRQKDRQADCQTVRHIGRVTDRQAGGHDYNKMLLLKLILYQCQVFSKFRQSACGVAECV